MMNDRIKDIWNKVDRQEEGTRWSIVITTESELEKFAELIVKECVNAVYDGTSDSEEYENRIKKHFGVE